MNSMLFNNLLRFSQNITIAFNPAAQARYLSFSLHNIDTDKEQPIHQFNRYESSVAVEEITEPEPLKPEEIIWPKRAPQNIKIHQNDIRYSPKRMNQVARFIQGREVDQALIQLKYLERPISDLLIRLIQNGVNQAEVKYGLRPQDMILKTFIVGPGVRLKRHNFQARGHAGVMRHRYSNIFVVLEQGAIQRSDSAEARKKAKQLKRNTILQRLEDEEKSSIKVKEAN
ncbi:hypothetical protein WA158_004621 [Blastocystis sp. Blastoise]